MPKGDVSHKAILKLGRMVWEPYRWGDIRQRSPCKSTDQVLWYHMVRIVDRQSLDYLRHRRKQSCMFQQFVWLHEQWKASTNDNDKAVRSWDWQLFVEKRMEEFSRLHGRGNDWGSRWECLRLHRRGRIVEVAESSWLHRCCSKHHRRYDAKTTKRSKMREASCSFKKNRQKIFKKSLKNRPQYFTYRFVINH